jgi:hypothetical protein
MKMPFGKVMERVDAPRGYATAAWSGTCPKGVEAADSIAVETLSPRLFTSCNNLPWRIS